MDYALLVALGIAALGLGVLLVALAGRDRRDHRTARQLAVVDRKLDAVLAHLGIEEAEEDRPAPAASETAAPHTPASDASADTDADDSPAGERTTVSAAPADGTSSDKP